MSVAVYSTIAETARPEWIPRRRPPAWFQVVPGDGRTLGELARVDPPRVHALAARASVPELRTAAKQVRGYISERGLA
jgi:hypothetical protein